MTRPELTSLAEQNAVEEQGSKPLSRQLRLDMMVAFARLLKGMSLYNQNNNTLSSLLMECHTLFDQVLTTSHHLSIRIIQDTCFCNNARVNTTARVFPLINYLTNEFRLRLIAEINFSHFLSAEQFLQFFNLLHHLELKNDNNFLLLRKRIDELALPGITVYKLEHFHDALSLTDSEDKKQISKDIYFKTLNLLKETTTNVRVLRSLQVRKIKRQMMNAVNMLMQDESSLLGLTNIKCYDDYTYNHSVNVAIYSLALGQRIRISKKNLTFLGMTGLFHDLGKTGIPRSILNKSDKLCRMNGSYCSGIRFSARKC